MAKHCLTASIVDWQLCHDDTGAGGFGLIPDMGIWLVVMAFAVYAFFSGGPGNLQWLYPNELFPTDIRASAVGVIMSLSRIGTIVST